MLYRSFRTLPRLGAPLVCATMILLHAMAPTPSRAAEVEWIFLGTVTSATGVFVGQGNDVTFTVAYDEGLTEVNPAGTGDENDFFVAWQPAGNQTLDWALEIEIGSLFYSTFDNANFVGTNHHDFELFDRAGLDEFTIKSNRIDPADDAASLSLRGFDLLFPTAGNLTGTANTLTGFDLSSPTLLFGRYEPFDASGVSEGAVTFNVTALPEPTLALQGSVGIAALMALARRRETT